MFSQQSMGVTTEAETRVYQATHTHTKTSIKCGWNVTHIWF